jgi:hypothetical protein
MNAVTATRCIVVRTHALACTGTALCRVYLPPSGVRMAAHNGHRVPVYWVLSWYIDEVSSVSYQLLIPECMPGSLSGYRLAF